MITSLDGMLHIAFYTYNVLLPEKGSHFEKKKKKI